MEIGLLSGIFRPSFEPRFSSVQLEYFRLLMKGIFAHPDGSYAHRRDTLIFFTYWFVDDGVRELRVLPVMVTVDVLRLVIDLKLAEIRGPVDTSV
jgi:hypothetical protein